VHRNVRLSLQHSSLDLHREDALTTESREIRLYVTITSGVDED
jgi:GTP cyclohydrolase I